jgi:amino acid adenylation domain-containing protein
MPAFRIKLILETLRPRVIICEKNTKDILNEMGYWERAFLYDEIVLTPVDGEKLSQIRRSAIDVDPVYVVFTSGSTGVPKGVIANHRSVIDYIEQLCEIMGFDENTVFGSQTPFYVDACLKEIFPTLKYGALSYLIPKPLFMFPVKLMEYIVENKINTVCWVVSALTIVSGFGALDKNPPHTLKTVAFGSEVFPPKQFNRWKKALPDARFVHLYGPTEATGMSAYYEADRAFAEDEAIPVGRPFKNTEILLLTDEGKIPPEGEPGEICIRGAGLSLGYYGDEEKTKAAFVQNPLSAFPDTIYKTGDLGKYNENGELIFLCRRDQQIKHMGHRIELAEIELAVSRLEGIRMACVVYDGNSGKIVLYYAAEEAVTPASVSAYCKATLPRYMSPSAYIPMDKLPLTPNGKVDRAGLLERYSVG